MLQDVFAPEDESVLEIRERLRRISLEQLQVQVAIG